MCVKSCGQRATGHQRVWSWTSGPREDCHWPKQKASTWLLRISFILSVDLDICRVTWTLHLSMWICCHHLLFYLVISRYMFMADFVKAVSILLGYFSKKNKNSKGYPCGTNIYTFFSAVNCLKLRAAIQLVLWTLRMSYSWIFWFSIAYKNFCCLMTLK